MYLSCIQGLPPLRNHQTMSVRQGRKGCRIQIGENKPSIIIIKIFYSNQTTIIVLYYVEYRTEQICLLCLQVKTIMHVWWRHVVLLWSHQRHETMLNIYWAESLISLCLCTIQKTNRIVNNCCSYVNTLFIIVITT